MFIAYIKYISLLLFSGLILTFYKADSPSPRRNIKPLTAFTALKQRAPFSLLNDVILPLFPVLNTGDMPTGNKK